MFKISVIYPRNEGTHFDADYYEHKHLPLAKRLFGNHCQHIELQLAVNDTQPFYAVAVMTFASPQAAELAFGPNMQELGEDMVKYTNTKAMRQVSTSKDL